MDTYDFSQLYKDAAFARRLAGGLVGKVDAEDLWHDVWRAFLERPPRSRANLPAYLRTIVMRMGLRQARGAVTRRAREQSAAAREALPSTAELAARMELHRLVVDCLFELEEPYRRTLFLSFFEDLSPTEVAEREGIPIDTVRTRARRALELLRERLERRNPGEHDWLAGLVVLADAARSPTRPTFPLRAVGAALALSVAGVVVWRLVREPAPSAASSLASAPAPEVGTGTNGASAADGGQRIALGEPISPAPLAPEPVARRLRGHVVDPDGRGIAAAEVDLRIGGLLEVEGLASTRTNAEGEFELALPVLTPVEMRNRHLELEIWAPGWQPLSVGSDIDDVSAFEQALVLRPGIAVEGRLLGPGGDPVPSALVVVESTLHGQPVTGWVSSDHRGLYRAGLEPESEIDYVVAWHHAIGAGFLPGDAFPRGPGAIVQAPDLELREHDLVRGSVTYPDGSPARYVEVGARCATVDKFRRGRPVTGGATEDGRSHGEVTSDEEGRFVVRGLRAGPWKCTCGSSSVLVGPGEEAHFVFDDHRALITAALGGPVPLADVRVAWTPLERTQGGAWRARAPSARDVTRAPGGNIGFATRPGATYAVTVLVPGWAYESVLEAPESEYETALTVELSESPARGAIELHDSGAAPSAPPVRRALRLETPLARIAVGTWPVDEQGLVHGLPCGRFLVSLVPLADDGHAPEPVITFAEPIEITPELAVLDVPRLEGARLSIVFATDASKPPDELAAAVPSTEWVTYALEREDALLRRDSDPRDAAPFLVLRAAAPDTRWQSEHALPAGDYRLEARFPKFEPVEQTIRIEPHQDLEVVVLLTRSAAGR